ncbi:SGNH hydrolase-type esterase domain-containing protein [Phialemonium atrogriseum]|uniref:SGNH hydrolase-type esterase domain-containing protein n=1 Tax=Phialemonium atrogriseum TaxID=1093897 RepID=A0AAJ0C4G0_9PEZI|nr:SGNH hydrolase-type esterase domain-containing protein [Phialemonium atrogriseum]KAK1769970.1 SGNH hydrolase-type esterase domain-containing protein [Phialemonium atrogriseum]
MRSSGLKTGLATLLLATTSVAAKCNDHWVAIWGTMPQLVEPANLPNPPFNGTDVVFQNATLRQTVSVMQKASTIRLQFSNVFGGSDLPITAVTVALPADGAAGASAIEPETLQKVTFSGSPSFTVPNGAVVFSDPVNITLAAQQVLTVTMYLADGQTTNLITGHPGSRTTSHMGPGNLAGAADIAGGGDTQKTDHWYFLTGIEAWLPSRFGSLVIVGDSITDGRGSTTNGNDRWPDQLAARLQSDNTVAVAVVNEAAGGNRVLADGLGPNALGRIDRDVVAQAGVRYALVYEGVNDLGGTTAAATGGEAQLRAVGDRLIAAFDQMVTRLHRFGIAVFGATITPCSGPGQAYGEPAVEAERLRVNEWIRSSGRFDAVVDFDAAVRDPANATQLNPDYNSGDYLHLNPAGYKAMAEAVDLALFAKFAGGVHTFM